MRGAKVANSVKLLILSALINTAKELVRSVEPIENDASVPSPPSIVISVPGADVDGL